MRLTTRPPVSQYYYGDVAGPSQVPESSDRRHFLAAGLGWLAFWRGGSRKLAGIRFRRLACKASSGRRFLLIHGNEYTARAVLTAHSAHASGTGWLVQHTTRNILFHQGALDPNRMFSDEGAGRNLRTLNPTWSEALVINGLLDLDRHRHEVVDAVRPHNGDVLIAVHNNGEGYSVRDEVDISDRVALNDEANPHEFCLCVDARDYEILSKGKYNVVLQNRAPTRDDGSLSRLAAREGFRYVNIEAGLGKTAKQSAMLQWLDEALPRVQS